MSLPLGLAGLALLVGGVALVLTLRGTPRQLRLDHDALAGEMARVVRTTGECVAAVEALEARWATFREEADDLLGQVEKKRRRANAEATRAERANGEAENADPMRAAIEAARRAGYSV